MDPKTAVSGRDWSGWDFLGIVFGIFLDFSGLQNINFCLDFVAFFFDV
jgi:hypothetical protein